MKALNRSNHSTNSRPIRILQFGEGNFLRAFVNWFVHEMNAKHDYDCGVVVVQPIERGMVDVLALQDGLYHHVNQGIVDGQPLDEVLLNASIQEAINPFEDSEQFFKFAASTDLKLIFSNTTEAGIQFDERDLPNEGLSATFPGKLVQFLQRRFEALGDTSDSEIGVIPCELIEANGEKLRKCLDQYVSLWDLGHDFQDWLDHRVHFANTLVDRIVPGYPKDEIASIQERVGFEDRLVVKSETFHLFVIEAGEFIQNQFPADRYGFNVKYVKSIVPYRTQKVRILNGAHTSMVPVGLLSGIETVRETVEDEQVGAFVKQCIFEEIVPTISLPGEDPGVFGGEVLARFQNPFIRHELMAISLNSISKWKVRVLPTVLDHYKQEGRWPNRLVFSLASLIQLHLSGGFALRDDSAVLEFFDGLRSGSASSTELTAAVLNKEEFWGQNLMTFDGLASLVANYLEGIRTSSVREALDKI